MAKEHSTSSSVSNFLMKSLSDLHLCTWIKLNLVLFIKANIYACKIYLRSKEFRAGVLEQKIYLPSQAAARKGYWVLNTSSLLVLEESLDFSTKYPAKVWENISSWKKFQQEVIILKRLSPYWFSISINHQGRFHPLIDLRKG